MKYIMPGFIDIQVLEDCFVLLNTFTEAKVEIEKKYYCDLSKIANDGCNEITCELALFLYENEMLFLKEGLYKTINEYFESNEEILDLVFLPTEKCNFRCRYCYENHDSQTAEPKLNYIKILEFLVRYFKTHPEIKYVNTNWFGGEPLLKLNEIIDCQYKIIDVCRELELILSSGITTNGYLLTEEVFNLLIHKKITNYQITLDGIRHDYLRPLANGDKTFDTILNNIKNMLRTNFDFEVIIRVNVDEDSTNNYAFYETIAAITKNDTRVKICPHNIFRTANTSTRLKYCDDKSIVEKNVATATQFGLKVISDTLNGIDICYASKQNCFTFRPNGEIVKCTVSLDEKWNHFGTSENEVQIFDFQKWNYISDKCINCIRISKCKWIQCLKHRMTNNRCNYMERKPI